MEIEKELGRAPVVEPGRVKSSERVDLSKSPTQPQRRTIGSRARSRLRLRYEAEAAVVRNQLGDLDEIRKLLGLSQRKISQMLLVDPSAWTRWTRPGSDAPPHIYRALEWLLLLEEKHPGLREIRWASQSDEMREKEWLDGVRASMNEFTQEMASELKDRMAQLEQENRQKWIWLWSSWFLFAALSLILWLS